MKRAKDKYMINRTKYKDIKRYDHQQMEDLKRSNPAEYAFGDYRIGRYAWVFENPVLFEKPIPARGRQGLWNWEDDANE